MPVIRLLKRLMKVKQEQDAVKMDLNQSRKAIFALEDRLCAKVLHKILETFCLSVPNLYKYKGLPVWYILYTVLFVVVLNAAFILQISERLETYFQTIPKTAAALEGISFMGMTFTNTLSIIFAIFLRRKQTVKLVKDLKEAENVFHQNICVITNKENAFVKIFIATHICFLLYFALDSYMYASAFGHHGISSYFMTYFNIYMLCLSVLQICSYALYIKHRVDYLNSKMLEIIGAKISESANDESSRESLENLRIFMKIFDRLCDAIEMINECFGIQIVLIVCNSVAFIIIGLNLCFKIILKRIGTEFQEDTAYVIFVNIWCSLLFVVSTYTVYAFTVLCYVHMCRPYSH